MENEIGNVNSAAALDQQAEQIMPKRIVGQEIVQCPITNAAKSIVKVDFCKKKCKYFKKFMEDANRIECNYPRFLEIISVYGEHK